jgi:hypothetical protein
VRRAQNAFALGIGLGFLRLCCALQWRHLGSVTVTLHEPLVLGLLHALATLLWYILHLLIITTKLEVMVRFTLHILHLSSSHVYVVRIIICYRKVIIARMIKVNVDVGAVHLEFRSEFIRIVIIDDDDLT